MNTENISPLVLLAYARDDRETAYQVYKGLVDHKVELWYDQTSMVPGSNWYRALEEAIHSATIILVLIGKGFPELEVSLAQEHNKPIISVLLTDNIALQEHLGMDLILNLQNESNLNAQIEQILNALSSYGIHSTQDGDISIIVGDHVEVTDQLSAEAALTEIRNESRVRKRRDEILAEFRVNIPPPPDTFAARNMELKRMSRVLLEEPCLAITGMGGVGKTTLALKLASDLAPHFPGGVVWLEASYGAGRPDLVDRLARKLGIDLAQEPLIEKRASVLQSVLAGRGRVLAVLDDLWDIDLGRWAGKTLLPSDRALLVTSRDVALCRALCNHVQRLDVLPEAEALELLTNLLGPLGRHEGTAKELVKLLDGHPLALEIAARRCDNGVEDLSWVVRRLRAGPTLGELKLSGQESRESSVEVSLALSYGDLNPDLQQRFRALGVFAPAPFDMQALVTVWGDKDAIDAVVKPGSASESAERAANELIRRGLLAGTTSQMTASAEKQARPLYAQHSLFRAYALALLEQQKQEKKDAANRHFQYYQSLTRETWQQAESFWGQVEQGWQWAWEAGAHHALAYYHDVKDFLRLRGEHKVHIKWLNELLGLPENTLDVSDRVTLLNNMGNVCYALGEMQQTISYYEQALSLSQKVGHGARKATALGNIGLVYAALGEKQQALAYYEQALPLHRQVGDRAGEAATLNNIGLVYADIGEKQQALAYYEQALPLHRQVGDRAGEAATLNNIGSVYDDLGEKQQTLAYYEQALPLYRQVGDRIGEATTLTNIGSVYSNLGEKQQALAYFEQALPLRRQVGDRSGEATTLNNIGLVYAALGEKQQALAYYEQALPLHRQVGDRAGEATTLNNMARIYFQQGQPDQASQMLRGAGQILHQIGAVAEEAVLLLNLAVVLHRSLGQTEEAIASVTQSIAILERYQLPRDAGGTTLADHKAFLARLQSSASDQGDAFSLDQLLVLVRQAREGDRGLAEQLTPFLQELASNPDIPAEGQTLAAVLLQILAGTTSPDLNGLPAELAEVIRRAFELPEA